MAKYHINPETGNPSKCIASKGACPYGGIHYESAKDARVGYEKIMANPFGSPEAQEQLRSEKLVPELEAYVTEGPLGRFLNHPLVQDLMVDAMPGMANQQLRHKKERLQVAIDAKDWHQYIYLHERPYRLDAVLELVDTYEPENAPELLRSAWMDSENIHQNFTQWEELIDAHGFAMDEEDQKIYDDLPDEITVFRGCSAINEKGLSWTLDEEKAKWFADRFERKGAKILEMKIPKDEVVAYLGGRGESEIVLRSSTIDKFRRK